MTREDCSTYGHHSVYIANSHPFFLVLTHLRRACHTSRALFCHPVFLRTFFQHLPFQGCSRFISGEEITSITAQNSKYSPTLTRTCSLRSSPSRRPSSGALVGEGRGGRGRCLRGRGDGQCLEGVGGVGGYVELSKVRELTFSTLPRSCIDGLYGMRTKSDLRRNRVRRT